MTHLTPATFSELVKDPAAHPELLAHLAQGCEVCDAFLAAHVDAFDGPVDALLLSLAPRDAVRDDVAWARFRRRFLRPAVQRRWAMLGAVAAALAVAVGVGWWWRAPVDETGVKGAVKATLELQAAVRVEGGRFEALAPAARVDAGGVLVFRAQSNVDGVGRIFLQRGDGPPKEVGAVRVRAGLHELERDEGLLGVDLSGEAGRVTVWVVASAAPVTAAEALSALQSGGTSDVAVARIEVLVEP
ncbi:MAG: hypothetical protein AB1938_13785 [Myxococcota bacterium]